MTVLAALSMAALLVVLALAIDLGALFNARSEAQRAADAAALAGASAFLDRATDGEGLARERAREYGTSNEVRLRPVAPEDLSVAVVPDSFLVRVGVRRRGVPTWFARLVGIDSVDVSAMAAARATPAGAAQCLKPFAVPDMWEETTDDENENRIWDGEEAWTFDPEEGDRYVRYSGPDGGTGDTGYGSAWRDGWADEDGLRYEGDYGRRITVKVTNPRQTIVSSFFFPWVLPPDPEQEECGVGGGGGGRGSGRGAASYRRNICTCNTSIIDLDTEYDIEPGNMVGPTFQGVRELVRRDPDAYWDDGAGTVVSDFGMDSPRVVTVALFDPAEIDRPGRQAIRFNNFARIFIEEQASPQDPVTGRFLYYVPGLGSGGSHGRTEGTLVRALQLVQ